MVELYCVLKLLSACSIITVIRGTKHPSAQHQIFHPGQTIGGKCKPYGCRKTWQTMTRSWAQRSLQFNGEMTNGYFGFAFAQATVKHNHQISKYPPVVDKVHFSNNYNCGCAPWLAER